MKKFLQLVIQSTEALNSRLFVILAAQQNGWQFARKLQFLESGGGENDNYMKVAKEFQKRQDKKEDEKELRGLAKQKPYARPKVPC